MYSRTFILGSLICVTAFAQEMLELQSPRIDSTPETEESKSTEVIAKPSALIEALALDQLFSGIAMRARNVPEGFAITSVEHYILRPKPWWLRASTEDWQWVAIDPKIYHPPKLDPLKYPAIIEHEKVHLSQQRKIGKIKWLIKYIMSKKFRFEQEMEPIVVELLNTPPQSRRQLAIKYANYLSGAPYSKAAKSFDLALEGIMSKANEMGVDID